MYLILQIAAVVLTALAMCTALAHALEFPGKLRLSREAYLTVQPIYYPGFTIAGFGEGLAIVTTLVVLVMSPVESAAFRWTLAGFIALLAMHAAYWFITHPVNKFWLRDQELGRAGGGFFAFDPRGRGRGESDGDGDDLWIHYRNRWEYSHIVRALLALIALVVLTVAVAL